MYSHWCIIILILTIRHFNASLSFPINGSTAATGVSMHDRVHPSQRTRLISDSLMRVILSVLDELAPRPSETTSSKGEQVSEDKNAGTEEIMSELKSWESGATVGTLMDEEHRAIVEAESLRELEEGSGIAKAVANALVETAARKASLWDERSRQAAAVGKARLMQAARTELETRAGQYGVMMVVLEGCSSDGSAVEEPRSALRRWKEEVSALQVEMEGLEGGSEAVVEEMKGRALEHWNDVKELKSKKGEDFKQVLLKVCHASQESEEQARMVTKIILIAKAMDRCQKISSLAYAREHSHDEGDHGMDDEGPLPRETNP